MSSNSTEIAEMKHSTIKPGLEAHPSTDVDVEERSDESENEQLKRNMSARHINMITIAGMIVTHPILLSSARKLTRLGNGSIP